MTKKLIFPVDRSRPGGRRPANQQRNTAGSRDGTPGLQPARRGGKANQNVTRTQDNTPATQNGPTTPTPDAPGQEEQPVFPTFNMEEIQKLSEANTPSTAEFYKPPKSPTKTTATGAPTSPWAYKPGQMANGKDFFLELRKQITEKMAERDREEGLVKEKQAKEESGSTVKGG